MSPGNRRRLAALSVALLVTGALVVGLVVPGAGERVDTDLRSPEHATPRLDPQPFAQARSTPEPIPTLATDVPEASTSRADGRLAPRAEPKPNVTRVRTAPRDPAAVRVLEDPLPDLVASWLQDWAEPVTPPDLPRPVEGLPPGWPHRIRRFRDRALMVLVPAGTFVMGSADVWLPADEKPMREVTLSSAYYIDETEVTFAQFDPFRESQGREPLRPWMPGAQRDRWRADWPAYGIRYEDAAAFAAWIGAEIPTEAQWERAAKGGGAGPFPWGARDDPSLRCGDGTPDRPWPASHPDVVGSYPPNAYGLYDMSGNVEEVCRDYYDPRGYADLPALDPVRKVPALRPSSLQPIESRVRRGGHWSSPQTRLRACARWNDGSGGPSRGLRCVRTLPAGASRASAGR